MIGSMKIRIALAQINPTVGDFDGNVRAVRRMTAEAKKRIKAREQARKAAKTAAPQDDI